jgi:hypothetical protein
MARISDRDRDIVLNTINLMSDRFEEHEINQIHEIALMLDEIRQSIIKREDSWNQR